MGVVNATPDSFSDTGTDTSPESKVAHGVALVAEGADILDVGGLSAITNVPTISEAEEIARVVPVITGLREAGIGLLSVDTWRAEVAMAAVEAGASIVNDISGLRHAELASVCAQSGAGLVLTHNPAPPKTRAVDIHYRDVSAELAAFLEDVMDQAIAAGVARDQTILDPGPDFSKSPAQTIEALSGLGGLGSFGRPVLLAVSRKDFIGALTRRRPRERLAGTLAAIGHGLDADAAILRVHDVAATVDYLKVRAALRGQTDVSRDLELPQELRRESRSADADLD